MPQRLPPQPAPSLAPEIELDVPDEAARALIRNLLPAFEGALIDGDSVQVCDLTDRRTADLLKLTGAGVFALFFAQLNWGWSPKPGGPPTRLKYFQGLVKGDLRIFHRVEGFYRFRIKLRRDRQRPLCFVLGTTIGYTSVIPLKCSASRRYRAGDLSQYKFTEDHIRPDHDVDCPTVYIQAMARLRAVLDQVDKGSAVGSRVMWRWVNGGILLTHEEKKHVWSRQRGAANLVEDALVHAAQMLPTMPTSCGTQPWDGYLCFEEYNPGLRKLRERLGIVMEPPPPDQPEGRLSAEGKPLVSCDLSRVHSVLGRGPDAQVAGRVLQIRDWVAQLRANQGVTPKSCRLCGTMFPEDMRRRGPRLRCPECGEHVSHLVRWN